jgi:poly(A) polymerase/tRNA nucleotidyltransferase (CCA-adding enzyme)
MKKAFTIPPEIRLVTDTLEQAGFEAYLVGGCVRDMYRMVTPKDWDVTTNAKPEEIMALFPKTFYENEYGTVGVVNEAIAEEDTAKASLRIVEVTPYRKETTYSNFRHPDKVDFDGTLHDDLLRRDFTMNAIAYNPTKHELIDPYGGEGDIERQLIKTVGKPEDRFHEDALRVMRAVRFGAELGFTIEKETMDAVVKFAHRLEHIAKERIRDEFIKIIMSLRPMEGIVLLERTGVLKYIAPELEQGLKCEQNGDHIYDVWEHNLRAVQHSADRGWPLHVRVAALLHDVAKPATRKWADEKKDWTFYGHDVVGGRMSKKMLERLKFPSKFIDDVSTLVRYHLFFSDIEKITLSAVRRIVANVGPELVWDLMNVRACDRIGMGRPKETPYRLRKYHSMIEEAMRAPVSVGMLKVDGAQIMAITGEKPGARIGLILHALFEEVLEDPQLNTAEYLEKRTKALAALPPEDLQKLGAAGKEKKEEKEQAEVGAIRKKYGVN